MHIEVHFMKSKSGVTKIENTRAVAIKLEAAFGKGTKAVYDHRGGSDYTLLLRNWFISNE